MADLVIGLEATDVFALGGNFHANKSSTRTVLDRAGVQGATGNNVCETMINQRDEVTVDYGYCNAIPDILTDLADFLTEFGNVQNSYIITQLAIKFAAGAYAIVTVTGHQHNAAAHAAGASIGYANVAAAVPANAGFGVPTPAGVTLGANSSPISMDITISMNHVDAIGATGAHIVGKNITPTAEVTVQFQGVPTTAQPLTGWTTDSYGGDDANSDFDTYEVTAHRYFDIAAA